MPKATPSHKSSSPSSCETTTVTVLLASTPSHPLYPLPLNHLRTNNPNNNSTPNPHKDPQTAHHPGHPSAAAGTCPAAAGPADSTCPAAADRIVLAVEVHRSPDLAAGMGSGCRSSLGCWALGCCSRAARRLALGRRRNAREQGLGGIAAVGLGYPEEAVSRWCERRVWRSMVDAM